MASGAKWIADNSGSLLTSGTTTAFTVATNQVEAALTAGYTVTVQFAATADVGATLAVDGLAAKPLQMYAGTALVGGEFPVGSIQTFTYSTTGTGQWIAQGRPGFTTLTGYQGAATVALNSTSAFFDGPSVSQGTTGIWLVSGSISLSDSNTVCTITGKLWDGTTVISAGQVHIDAPAAVPTASIALTGIITNPAANLKISALSNSVTSFIWNTTILGTTNASYITATRIG